jgi:hypothetical protein
LVGVDREIHQFAAGGRLTLNGALCRFQVVEFYPFGRCDRCTRESPNVLVPLTAMRSFAGCHFAPAVQNLFYLGCLPGKLALLKLDGNQVDLPGRGACCRFGHRTCRVAAHYQSDDTDVCDPGHICGVMCANFFLQVARRT